MRLSSAIPREAPRKGGNFVKDPVKVFNNYFPFLDGGTEQSLLRTSPYVGVS